MGLSARFLTLPVLCVLVTFALVPTHSAPGCDTLSCNSLCGGRPGRPEVALGTCELGRCVCRHQELGLHYMMCDVAACIPRCRARGKTGGHCYLGMCLCNP